MTAEVATSVNASSRVWMSYSIMKLQGAEVHTANHNASQHSTNHGPSQHSTAPHTAQVRTENTNHGPSQHSTAPHTASCVPGCAEEDGTQAAQYTAWVCQHALAQNKTAVQALDSEQRQLKGYKHSSAMHIGPMWPTLSAATHPHLQYSLITRNRSVKI